MRKLIASTSPDPDLNTGFKLAFVTPGSLGMREKFCARHGTQCRNAFLLEPVS